MKKLLYALLVSTAFISCSKDITEVQEDQIKISQTYGRFEIFNDEFKIGSNLGLIHMNDMAVGVIKNDNTGVKIVTSALLSGYVMEGPSLKNLTKATEVTMPAEYENPSDTDAIDYNYSGMGTVITTPSGMIYGPYHGEWHTGETFSSGIPAFYSAIGLASSSDGGQTFQKHGTLIPDILTRDSDHEFLDWGLGEPAMAYSRDSTEVFVYYVDHNRMGKQVEITMAKFSAPNKEPDFSTPYMLTESNTWTTDTIRSRHTITHGGQTDTAFPQVQFNKTLNKYVMIYNVNAYMELINSLPANESGVYITTSSDGINWENPIQIITDYAIKYDNYKTYTWHPTIIYNNEMHSEGYIVYSTGDDTTPHWMMGRSFKIN